jgi:hypothetical protein
MKRSSMLDAVLVTAFLVGATALMAFVRGTPDRCPQASPASVENLFAPCLAGSREDARAAPAEIAALDFPPPPIQPRTPAPSRDVEATGSITPER